MPAKKTTTKTAGPARPKAVSKSPKTVADLTPNAANPRKPWSDAQRAAFQKSLAEFGDLSGIVFNKTTGQLVGGHKRVAEFKEDPDAKIVSEPAEGKPKDGTLAYGHVTLATGTRFAYREVSWPKAKEAAANLAANQWGAEWDFELVADMLGDVKLAGIDTSMLGFSDTELKAFDEPTQKENAPSPTHADAVRLTSVYEVVVECGNEATQREVFESLTKKGHVCRLSTL